MKKTGRVILTLFFLLAFLAFTWLTMTYDLAGIGPDDTYVGFSSINGSFASSLGVNEPFLELSEYLGYAALAVVPFFGLMGLWQWISRRSLFDVDLDLFKLAAVYVLTLAFYIFFEMFIVNYRPIALEASYPSSHTVLACTIFGTAIVEGWKRIRSKALAVVVNAILLALAMATVLSRLLSGVHWLTDIIGGVILSMFLVSLFYSWSYRD